MLVKSPFGPLPPFSLSNVHHWCFNRPEQADITDHVLYIDALTGQSMTRSEFLHRVYDGATALYTPTSDGGLGLSERDIVGIMSENTMDYITLVHSLLAITTPFVLIPPQATPLELDHFIKISRMTCLFVNANVSTQASEAFRRARIPENRMYIMEGSAPGKVTFSGLIDYVRTKKTKRVSVRHPPKDALAYLVFSSGTTGLPKAVMISHHNLCVSIAQAIVLRDAIMEVFTPPPIQTASGIPISISVLPFYHSYGLHVTMLRYTTPSTAILLPRWDIDLVLECIRKYRVSNLLLVPSLIHQLVNSPQFQKADLSSVVSVFTGAAHLPPDLAEKLEGIVPNIPTVSEGYGLSEATISAITKHLPEMFGSRIPLQPGCIGVLIPGVEGRIVREDGSEADVDESGELLIKGDNVALGYLGNEKATKETFLPDGWLRTGDHFRVNKDGLFFFEDRAKDTLKISGHQVSPTEIENVLLAHPDKLITDVSVAGVPGGRTEDEKVPHAWVVLSDAGRARGNPLVCRTLEAWAQKNLSKFKWLRAGIEIIDEIPKSPTGKVLRRVLQDQYAQKLASRAKL